MRLSLDFPLDGRFFMIICLMNGLLLFRWLLGEFVILGRLVENRGLKLFESLFLVIVGREAGILSSFGR
jgi:hypothetical protein